MHQSRPQSSRGQQSCLYQFVDMQSFLVGRHFVVKEFAALKDVFELSHLYFSLFLSYIFGCSKPWSGLTKAERHQAMWLIENRHEIQWDDGMVPYSMARSLITKAVMDATTTDDEIFVYVKGHEKREAGFTPGWCETGSICWKYRGALRRHKISK